MALSDYEATDEFRDLKPYSQTTTVRRPRKDESIQVQIEKAHKNLVLVERNSRFYLVGKKAQLSLGNRAKTYVLIPCLTQNGVLFFWPLLSSRLATVKQLEEAKGRWLNISWSKSSRAFDVAPSKVQLSAPNWPSDDFEVAAEAAFGNRLIKDKDDPLVTLIKPAEKRPKRTT